ncbi:hypothetical protein [Nocardia harenae]|uniref:hypothetical protein n=1 Tax=Nocardia harenae TaxID=358707 RepID=UPI0009FFE5B8|nr:hypothetical protein [Nocardia harenae]
MIESGDGRAALRDEIASFYRGFGQPEALLAAFRSAALLVPITADGRLSTTPYGGVEWVCGFTGEPDFARYVLARGLGVQENHRYHTIFGADLADWAERRAGVPTGVLVDIAGAAPMAFPPDIAEEADEQ